MDVSAKVMATSLFLCVVSLLGMVIFINVGDECDHKHAEFLKGLGLAAFTVSVVCGITFVISSVVFIWQL
jgi:hypothetical protein